MPGCSNIDAQDDSQMLRSEGSVNHNNGHEPF